MFTDQNLLYYINGSGLDSPSAGTVRAQTPRSSKKVHRRTRERAGLYTVNFYTKLFPFVDKIGDYNSTKDSGTALTRLTFACRL